MKKEFLGQSIEVNEEEVYYKIYSPLLTEGSLENRKFQAESLAVRFLGDLEPLTKDILWQKEKFNLQVLAEEDDNSQQGVLVCIGCSTSFGENVNDEWYIVHLLMELSKMHKDLIITVNDIDGEFLLIETAQYLPPWLQPNNAENRVFLVSGFLHIIPLPQTPAEFTSLPIDTPSLPDALTIIRDPNINTKAQNDVQKCLHLQLESSVTQMAESKHYITCLLPLNIIEIINRNRQLISSAIEYFCQRDPIDTKIMKRNEYFPFSLPGPINKDDAITVMKSSKKVSYIRICLTRCLYAQLNNQKCPIPKEITYEMQKRSPKEKKALTLGLKLCYGFEILLSRDRLRQQKQQKHSGTSNFSDRPKTVEESDLGIHYEMFMNDLQNKGYFKGEMIGSRLYKELKQNALNYYIQHIHEKTSLDTEPDKTTASAVLNELYNDLDLHSPYLKDYCVHESLETLLPDSSDSWMEVSQEQLQEMWEMRMGMKPNKQSESTTGDNLANSMKSFLSTISSYEGAEPEGSVELDSAKFFDFFESMLNENDMPKDAANEEDGDELLSDEDIVEPYSDGDDDDDDENDENGDLKGLREYMTQMDSELNKTNISKSFHRVTKESDKRQPETASSGDMEERHQNNDDDPGNNNSNIDKNNDGIDVDVGAEGEEEEQGELNVDFNLVKNFLDSYSSQPGVAGPVGNILSSMGILLPDDDDDNDEDSSTNIFT